MRYGAFGTTPLRIDLQNIKPLSCYLYLAPQQRGFPQFTLQPLAFQCYLLWCVGQGTKELAPLASFFALYGSNNLNLKLSHVSSLV